jgi:two-component system, cell cycle sensor histidine kinase and response regulator CckA
MPRAARPRRPPPKKRAPRARRDREREYESLFEHNPLPMWVFDLKTLRFLAVNDAAVRHYGYSRTEFLGLTIKDIRPADEIPRLLDDVSRVAHGTIDPRAWNADVWTHRRKDGTLFEVEIHGTEVKFGGRKARVVLAKDVSTERRLEGQVRQLQKMDAVGRLAGGMTHDFNNILYVISGYAEQIRRRPEGSFAEEKARAIIHAADRAAALTRQLLTFSRQTPQQPRVLDLGTTLAQMEDLLRGALGDEVALVLAPEARLGRVRADPGQIEQLVMNLSINARDAMPGGGRLTIEARDVDVDAAYARLHLGLPPGRYVMLSASDTGCGMDAEVQSHIFEPFFTTKSKDKGTGLGLSIVYGIVKQNGGHIEVYSHPGHGTTFKVYLPRTLDEADPTVAEATVPPPAGRGSETILVVEDDDDVRCLTREALEENGYTVVEARDEAEALAALKAGPPHLLLTDMMLKKTTGPELARSVAAVAPDVRVVYMSGYTDVSLANQGVMPQGASFLQKPFTLDALLRTVKEVLAGTQG